MTIDGEDDADAVLSSATARLRFACDGVDWRACYARDGDDLWLDFDGVCRRFIDRTYAPPRLKDERCRRRGALAGQRRHRRGRGEGRRHGAARTGARDSRGDEDAIFDPRADRRRDRRRRTRSPADQAAGAGAAVRHRSRMETIEMDKAVVTCALTGVLTDPAVYPAPVTPEEMAREARRACDEGASVVHVHFRRLEPGKGHLPSWEPEVATAVVAAIRDACPGHHRQPDDRRRRPRHRRPTRLPARRQARDRRAQRRLAQLSQDPRRRDLGLAADAVRQSGREGRSLSRRRCANAAIEPEFECFDTGIVRTAAAIARNCGYRRPPKYNFVMGVEFGHAGRSGPAADPDAAHRRRRALERDRDRPQGDLAAAPPRRRTRRRPAHRPRGHDLSARRLARRLERRTRQGAGRCRPRGGTRRRLARGSARSPSVSSQPKEARP